MSKEHIIADWVKSVVPRTINSHTSSSIQVFREPGRAIIAPSPPTTKQGNLGQRKLRRVCDPCNRGWMKEIQDDTRPILIPLISGVWEGLDAAKGSKIANWTAMTVMNIDAADFGGSGVPANERRWLHDNHKPPQNWMVWLGRRTGGEGLATYHRPFKVHQRGLPIPNDKTRDSQITTVEIGQIVLHALSMPPGLFSSDPIDYGRIFGVIPIFPAWGGDVLDWRYAPFLDSSATQHLANGLVHEMLGRSL